MPGSHVDATPPLLAVTCPQCGAAPRQRCKRPAGNDAQTHKARYKAAGEPWPPPSTGAA